MKNFEEINKELNKDPTPLIFHDTSLINMLFNNGNLYLRLCQYHYMDDFNILKNDKEIALYDVVYKGIDIKKMDMKCDFEFIGSEVMNLNEENGIINLCLLDSDNDFHHYFDIYFTCKSYEWKIFKIISEDEYYQYFDDVDNRVSYKVKDNTGRYAYKIVGPELGRFEDVD